MAAKKATGVFQATKKNGQVYYRSSITYHEKHISLGSYNTWNLAHEAYKTANFLLNTHTEEALGNYCSSSPLLFSKWVSLLNFRDNHIYIKNPIYLKKGYFIYYLSKEETYLFDIDDLFYYSEHKIMKRNGHLFVSDYGMQVTILSRYGIKNYAVPGRDYVFINGNPHDLRYENILVINPYNGVRKIIKNDKELFQAKIHVKGNYVIGTYATVEEAAVAYNKAIDTLKKAGSQKDYQPNYLETLTGKEYADIYSQIKISPKLFTLAF